MKETDNVPCLKTNQQLQIDLVTEFIAKYGDAIISYPLGKYCTCGCGGVFRVYAVYTYDNVLKKDMLYIKFADEDTASPSRSKLRKRYVPWLLGKRDGVDELYLTGLHGRHEVIKLTSSADSPLCSVLAAEGTLHNVFDTGWSSLSQVGGSSKT